MVALRQFAPAAIAGAAFTCTWGTIIAVLQFVSSERPVKAGLIVEIRNAVSPPADHTSETRLLPTFDF
jgi:hypothetical protein